MNDFDNTVPTERDLYEAWEEMTGDVSGTLFNQVIAQIQADALEAAAKDLHFVSLGEKHVVDVAYAEDYAQHFLESRAKEIRRNSAIRNP